MSEDWVDTTLGEIAEIRGGGTPSTRVPSYWNGDVVWLTPTEVVRADGQRVSSSERRISQEGLAHSSAKLMPPGAVLLTSRASVGFAAIADVPLTTNQGFQSLIPQKGVLSEFLMYWIQGNRDEFSRRASGSTFPEISKTKVASIPILIPPLQVQRRIVDVMAHLDDHLATLRVEREAVHGIWLAMINSSFSNNTWPRVPIGEVVAAGGGRLVDGDWIESKDQAPEGIRLLQLADLSRGRFLNKSERFVSRETFQRLHCTDIKKGDLLISRMADPIGRTSRVPDDLEGSIAAVDIAILTPGLDLDGDYLLGILNSTPWIETCDTRGTGTTRKRISKGNLAKIEIPVPDLSAQQRLGVDFAGCVATIEYIDLEVSAVEGLRHRLLAALLGGHACIADSYDSLLQGVA